jgi:hypothetical protein
MFTGYFYHERIRKSVAIFGSLFNNIYVLRKNSSGQVISQTRVPLAYAPSRDYLERIKNNASLTDNTKIAIKLPRMSFEITGYRYDPTRQLNKMGARNTPSGSDAAASTDRQKLWNYTPYMIDLQLNIYTHTQDDALQIIEQILPFFAPQYTVTIRPFANLNNLKEDVPITLSSVDYSDDYTGSLGDRRSIIYTLAFSMPANFYQGGNYSGIINKVTGELFSGTLTDSDAVLGTILPSATLTVEPNPLNASPDSDYGFNETLIEL